MVAAPPKIPPRKQVEHSRSRKFFGYPVGPSSALIATSFGLLLLCSLIFLDMEIIYHKTGIKAPQLSDEPVLSEALASSEPNSTIQAATPIIIDTDTGDDDVAIPFEVSSEEKMGSTASEEEVVSTVSEEEMFSTAMDGPEGEVLEEEIRDENSRIEMPRPLKGCDITQGRWVYDNVSYPLYRTKNCPFADPGFRCEDNGRPDKEFMSYHWQPHACDLPRFNASDILERLRGQRMVFVGDSLGRNNWESMLCMLAEGVPDKTRIYEVNGEPITKHSGKLIYRFKDYNCTVEYYRDPFLVPQTRPPKDSPANVTCVLRVDHVSWSTEKWINADIIIFNAGHWWTEHKIFRQGCRFQENGKLQDYDLLIGLGKAMQMWATYLEKHLNSKKLKSFGSAFLPCTSCTGGTWNRGGHCHQEKRPLTEEEARNEWQTPWMNQIVQQNLMPNIKQKLESVTYLDITTATNYRPDGHGALYTWDTKKFGLKPRNRQDCSHFCLPGVPDAWNELIFGSLFAKGKHPWILPLKL